MEKQVYKNDKYTAFKVERGLGALAERMIIRNSAGENQLDIGITVTAVSATGETGLGGVNILEWLWKQATNYLENNNPTGKKIIIISDAVRNQEVVLDWEDLEVEKEY